LFEIPPALAGNRMKTNRFTNIIAAAFGAAALSTACCAENEPIAQAPLAPAKEVAATTTTASVPGPTTTVPVAVTASRDAGSAEWADIKDCTYDMRAQFFEGMDRLEARVDREIGRLTARRAIMKSTANTKDWDFAMKEMESARSSLKSMGEELRKASPETWDQVKDKVGQAWVRTQDAYDKVKSSMTS
jgi:hypothetical protein